MRIHGESRPWIKCGIVRVGINGITHGHEVVNKDSLLIIITGVIAEYKPLQFRAYINFLGTVCIIACYCVQNFIFRADLHDQSSLGTFFMELFPRKYEKSFQVLYSWWKQHGVTRQWCGQLGRSCDSQGFKVLKKDRKSVCRERVFLTV